MSRLEIAAALFGVVNIILLVRRSVWNYAFGLAMVALYAPVFFAARLYSDAALQLFFFALNVYGWINWHRSRARAGVVTVVRLGWPARARWAAGAAVATLAWGAGMARFTDAAHPYWDGSVAVLSLVAQALLARRLIENWPLWMLVDLLAIGLYLRRDLLPTAGLYALFLVLSGFGWREWHLAAREAARRPATA